MAPVAWIEAQVAVALPGLAAAYISHFTYVQSRSGSPRAQYYDLWGAPLLGYTYLPMEEVVERQVLLVVLEWAASGVSWRSALMGDSGNLLCHNSCLLL